MIFLVTILFELVLLHGVDGKEIWVNPESVVSMRGPSGQKLLPEGAKCMLSMVDSHFLSIRESCSEAKEAFERAKK
jgi:hypothetical protein